MAAIEELAYNDETHAYWLTLPGGKKRRAKNVSSVAKVPDDPYNLTAWGKRQVAIGLASRPDLLESVAAHWDDKTKLNDICTQASDAADARKAATAGTTAHRITERVDLGEAVLDTPLAKRVATMWTDLLAGNGLTVVPDMVERVVVHPDRYVCGTFDRLVRTRDGRLLIADIKTGTSAINFPHSTAVQLALYANAPFLAARWGSAASGSTRTFTPFGPELDELDRSVGLVLYLPLDEGAEGDATVYEYDLDAAWRCVTDVIWPTLDWRTHDKDQLRYPYEPPAPATTGSDPVEVRRVALLDAVRALPGPARAAIKTAWPASLPPLTAPDGWTAERLEVVDALVALAGGPGTAAVAAEAAAAPSPATPWARLSAAERDRRARAGQVPADAQPADETLEQIRGRWSALPVELRLYGAWLTHINGGYWPRHDLTARHWLAETAQAHLGLLDYLEGLTGRLCDTGDVGDEDAKGRWQGRCREHGVTTADAAAHAKTIARALDRPAPRRIADWDDPEIAPRLHAWMLIPPDTTTTTGVEGVDEQRGAA
ncbi:MAG: hypothetical protein KJ056_12625 [Acidimicrobiia bacterium]|nr:hypothetical protein [Acidimicrobiia bacterium]